MRLLPICLFAFMLLAQEALCGEVRVAVVDMEYALREFYKSQMAEGEIERQKQEFVAEIERMQVDLRELEGQFKSAREATHEKGLSEDDLRAKLESAEERLMEVKECEKRLYLFAQQKKSELLAQSERMRKTLLDEICGVVQVYAKEKGLLVVIDSSAGSQRGASSIVYCDTGVDITADLIRILNKGKESKKGDKR